MSNVINNAQRSRFELEQGGLVAVAEYEIKPEVMYITHVIVPTPLRGQGLANALGKAVIEHARQEKIKIYPLCPFMVAYCQRHPDTADVVVG